MISIDELYHITLTSGIHAVLFIIFSVIMYFTVIIKMEHSILTNFIVNGAKIYDIDKLPVKDQPSYDLMMKYIKYEADKEEKTYESHNNKLKLQAVKAIIIAIIIFLLYVYVIPIILNIKVNVDYRKTIRDGLILLLVVGIYEYLFLKYVILEYAYYNFNNFLYDYIIHNINAIKMYLPSIIIHFVGLNNTIKL